MTAAQTLPISEEVAVEPGKGAATSSASPRVVGLDLSLVATGVAGDTWAETVSGGSLTKHATLAEQYLRVMRLRRQLLPYIDGADYVVVEGPSYGSSGGNAHERAHLWWRTIGRALARELPVAVVSPSTLKVYATGDGGAAKKDVLAAARALRPDVEFADDNAADAWWLVAMVRDRLGTPLVDLDDQHRRALASVDWPEVTT